ncbi:MAG: ribbon-helix-helix protein, CopG family [Nitrospira sp.]|nr:MAG: ribbon-helix-helix protein, CopG family [Nitrospira sp.]
MTSITVSLTDEEIRRLEELSRREGLTVGQMIRLGINVVIAQPDESFRTAANRVMEKNAEL